MKPRQTESIAIDLIEIGQRHRAVDDEAVERLARSMNEIGLRTPISVRQDDGGPVQLVTGLHRLNAAKSIGWDHIDCFVFENETDIEAEMWEIAENLHRAGLSKEQRHEHIRRYAELLKAKKELTEVISDNSPRPVGRPESIATKVAKDTGLTARQVRNVLSKQTPAITDKFRRSKIDSDVKARAAKEIADILAEHVPASLWDGVKANLYGAGAANIANEFTNITGQTIMDRRFAS